MNAPKWSWVKLLAFCLTSVFVAALALALILATATLALAASDDVAAPTTPAKTFSGMVTDSYCGARHKDAAKGPQECARECLRHGAKYVLISGDDTYVLAGNQNILKGLVGQRARISGILEGNTLRVGSISFAP